ncbi:MAG: hydrogenase maturation nickel metallochaperone HypA [Methanopyri archaeon]|nr:hydrogenase maturation nickel metallochaperone HypA [Methanopyri archaeon]
MIIDTVLEVAEREGASKILSVEIRVGELTMVNTEQLKFCLEVLSEGTPAEGASFKLETVPGVFRCKECGHEWEARVEGDDPALHSVFGSDLAALLGERCPECGSRDFEIVSGDECTVVSMEVEKG